MGNLKMTFFIDLVYELRGVNEKLRNAKSWHKDRPLKFSCQKMHSLHPMTTRGRFVKNVWTCISRTNIQMSESHLLRAFKG